MPIGFGTFISAARLTTLEIEDQMYTCTHRPQIRPPPLDLPDLRRWFSDFCNGLLSRRREECCIRHGGSMRSTIVITFQPVTLF